MARFAGTPSPSPIRRVRQQVAAARVQTASAQQAAQAALNAVVPAGLGDTLTEYNDRLTALEGAME